MQSNLTPRKIYKPNSCCQCKISSPIIAVQIDLFKLVPVFVHYQQKCCFIGQKFSIALFVLISTKYVSSRKTANFPLNLPAATMWNVVNGCFIVEQQLNVWFGKKLRWYARRMMSLSRVVVVCAGLLSSIYWPCLNVYMCWNLSICSNEHPFCVQRRRLSLLNLSNQVLLVVVLVL